MGEKLHFLLDMDGVLCDFLSGALKALNKEYGKNVTLFDYATNFGKWETYDFYGISEIEFWRAIHNDPVFWYNLEPIPWAKLLLIELQKLGDVTIVTTPSLDPNCASQKLQWLDKYLGIRSSQVFVGSRKHLMAGNGILIDDYSNNIEAFKGAGGEAILVPSVWNTYPLSFAMVWDVIIKYINFRESYPIQEELTIERLKKAFAEGIVTPLPDNRIQFSTGMVRDGAKNKPRFDLITPLGLPFDDQILTRWAKHMGKGAEHYSARNWEKASTQEESDRFKESAFRHFMQWYYDLEDEDHASSLFFNITGYEMVKVKMRNKDENIALGLEKKILTL